MTTLFLHGQESSGSGRKGRWFRQHFPTVFVPDFSGSLEERLMDLQELLKGCRDLVLVGSSFGGLMAAVLALDRPDRLHRIVLLAPALNFPEFRRYTGMTSEVETHLFVGRHDTICPPETVVPLAEQAFANLAVRILDDDHLLSRTFTGLDWQRLLAR